MIFDSVLREDPNIPGREGHHPSDFLYWFLRMMCNSIFGPLTVRTCSVKLFIIQRA